jgi:GH24 family phage-related lysozyme (muramidase)
MEFQTEYEDRCNFLYIDRLGLVTTGIGNLCDPVTLALHLPWKQSNGNPATLNQIQDEWIKVKDRQDLRGAPIAARKAITTLRLDNVDVNALFNIETDRMWVQIVSGYPDADQWPADAQLATLSMCWAMGAGRILPGTTFQYPKWRAAALVQDWATCAAQCHMQGVGIDGRNAENVKLFKSAATVGSLDEVHWP